MDEKVKEIKGRLTLREINAFPWKSEYTEDIEYLLSLLEEKEGKISYWKHQYDLELAHSKQAEKEIKELENGIEDILNESTISYVVEKRLKELMEGRK